MQHENWIWEPSEGGQVDEKTLDLRPVDPVAYKMKDIWGYDQDQFPIEPFDIEVRITAPTVRDGLNDMHTPNSELSYWIGDVYARC